MDRRGIESTLMIVVSVIIVLAITAPALVWMSSKASGAAVENEMKAKQVALLIDSAEPGTTIFVDSEIIIEGNEAVVVENYLKVARYSFFSNRNVEYKKVQGGTEIYIK
jgi:flagellar basal body-associated protein FliL